MNKCLSSFLLLIFMVNLGSSNLYTVTVNTGDGNFSANGTAFVLIMGRIQNPRRWETHITNGTILPQPAPLLPNKSYPAQVDSKIYASFLFSPLKFQWIDQSGSRKGESGIIVSNISLVSTYRRIPRRGCYYPRNPETPITSGQLREFDLQTCRQ